jgi:hypothetical protein
MEAQTPMSITLNIPEAVLSELTNEAERLGVPLHDYMVTILATGRASEQRFQNGVDLVAYWRKEDVVGCRTDISDCAAHASEVRKAAERRI